MKQTKNSKLTAASITYAIPFGVLAGVLMILLLLCLQNFGQIEKGVSVHWSLSVFLTLTVGGSCFLHNRKKALNIRQSYMYCVFVGAMASLFFAVLLYTFICIVDLGFVQDYIQHKTLLLTTSSELTEKDMQEQIKILGNVSPLTIAVSAFLELCFINILISLGLAFFLKKEN